MGLYHDADDPTVAFLVRSVNNQYAGLSQLDASFTNTTSAGIVSAGPRCEGQAIWKVRDASGHIQYFLLGR